MSFDEKELGELLRLLPPAPERLIARAQELPLHFGDEADDTAGGEDDHDDGVDGSAYHHDDALPPDDLDLGGDMFDEDDSPDGEWS